MTPREQTCQPHQEIERAFSHNLTFRERGDTFLIDNAFALRFNQVEGPFIRVWIACSRKVQILFSHPGIYTPKECSPQEGIVIMTVVFNPHFKRDA